MIYQLGKLEKWINTDIAPENLIGTLTDSEIKGYLDFAKSEKDRICDYFRAKAIEEDSSAVISKLIQAHQVGLTSLIANAYAYVQISGSELTPELISFYIKVCQIIEEIISLLTFHFPEFFNPDLPITHTKAELSRQELRRQLEMLDPIKQNGAMDRALLRMTFWPFREYIEDN